MFAHHAPHWENIVTSDNFAVMHATQIFVCVKQPNSPLIEQPYEWPGEHPCSLVVQCLLIQIPHHPGFTLAAVHTFESKDICNTC